MLSRSQSLRRTPLTRSSTWKRRVKFTGPMPDVVEAVLERCERDGVSCCEVCGDPLTGERGTDWAIHHRRFRDERPDTHLPQNLLAVCGASNVHGCHGRIHGNKAEAQVNGWAITRHGFPDPRLVPVLIDHESRWVYLDEFGGYEGAA